MPKEPGSFTWRWVSWNFHSKACNMMYFMCGHGGGNSHPQPINTLQQTFEDALCRVSCQSFYASSKRSSSQSFLPILLRQFQTIMSKIFSIDNLLHMFEGEGYGLCIDSILDNIFKFGGKNELYNKYQWNPFLLWPWSYTKRQAVTVHLNSFLLSHGHVQRGPGWKI